MSNNFRLSRFQAETGLDPTMLLNICGLPPLSQNACITNRGLIKDHFLDCDASAALFLRGLKASFHACLAQSRCSPSKFISSAFNAPGTHYAPSTGSFGCDNAVVVTLPTDSPLTGRNLTLRALLSICKSVALFYSLVG